MKKKISIVSITAALLTAQLLSSIPGYATSYNLSFQSNPPKLYHLTLTGHVQSMFGNCPGAEVRLEVYPAKGKPFVAKATTRPDGSFKVKVSFRGYADNEVAWKLTAQSNRLASLGEEGRQILSREPTMVVHRSIQLTEDILYVASLQ